MNAKNKYSVGDLLIHRYSDFNNTKKGIMIGYILKVWEDKLGVEWHYLNDKKEKDVITLDDLNYYNIEHKKKK